MKKIKCKARDCKRMFVPRNPRHQYHSLTCKNREAQARLRELARIGQAMVERAGAK